MRNRFFLVATFVFAGLFLTSCKTNNKKETKEITEQKAHKHEKDCADVHWSHHKGEEGPEHWKDLCVDFKDCGGKAQSPINIVTENLSAKNTLKVPVFSYSESKVAIINNGHTVQFNVTGDNTVDLNGKDYKLLQFHYHTKSEHTINGKQFPIEVHFVHKYSDSDYAVLGIMFEEGDANPLFTKYLDNFPTSKGEFDSEDMIDVLSLFPENKSYYNYKGSLTTPPCSEVVNWYVLQTPLTASKEQISKFSAILDNNFRPIMPLNDRVVQVFNQ